MKTKHDMSNPFLIDENLAKDILEEFSLGNYIFMKTDKRMCGAFYAYSTLYEMDFYGHVAVLSYKDSDEDYTKDELHDNIRHIASNFVNIVLKHNEECLPNFTSHGPMEIVIEFFKSI